ncbi:putative D-cysteine desulfhydrase 1, mitochondrial [Ananas comosus]|uniref:Putative D-cysteine desulfhydrase 1, mitochondrial n=1 Tax=Ananas comosus TaxID=4615 RepID=A0A199UZB2_ANACO|nr:putative D-cysteine desulfhydrase 1, mitochondrial [Ananas comosus]
MAARDIGGFLSKQPYHPPSWASHLRPIPSHSFSLGHLPTPIHKWNLPNLPEGTEVWIKRDDLSGMQLSGNKVRKLEFLMADAVAQGADCVITVGGIQSNHCRATAVAARYLNLDCYLILRTSKVLVDKDPGLVGNLLVERLVGAHIELVSKEEYAKIGSVAKGLGYAMNTAEELEFVKKIAAATGIVLDPVYSGKAAYGMLKDMDKNPAKWKGQRVLFVHTGGLLGLYDKTEQMASLVGNWRRMEVDESVPRKDGTGKMF